MILRAVLLVAAAAGCFVASFAAVAGNAGPALAAGSVDAMKSSVIVRGVVPPPGSQIANSGNVAPADGQTYIQIMVTLRDSSGNAVTGKTVVLQQTAGFPHGVTVTSINGAGNSMVSNQNGVATFDIRSTTPDTLQFRAQDVTDSITFSGQTATIIFTAYSATPTPSPAPTVGPADPVRSSVVVWGVVAPGSQFVHSGSVAPADGQTQIKIMVTLKDSYGNKVVGKTVVLQQTAGFPHGVSVTNLNGPGNSMVSNQNGVATFSVTSTTPDQLQFMAHDTTDSVIFSNQPATITFTAHSAQVPPPTATPMPQQTHAPVAGLQALDEDSWRANAIKFRGRNGQHFTYACSAGGPPFVVGGDNFSGVYGTDIYTDDSPVCLAAVHAGLITLKGGKVTIEIRPRADSYTGSTRNGITTIDYGTCECGSYVFVGGPSAPRIR